MKGFLLGFVLCLFLMALLFFYIHGVGKNPRHDATSPDQTYSDWDELTQKDAVTPTALQLEVWTQRVREAFTPFEAERAAVNFPIAYAETFYFRDAFHLYTEIEPMTTYMVETAKASPGVTFDFRPPVSSGIEVYLPWTMMLNDQQSVGVSHLRFNSEGRVIFHQDYWDSADVLVPKVPVANGLIELVRRQF